jgi:hypothetical protein
MHPLRRGKKQFQFLENPASPYHAYYKQRVRFGAEGPPPELVAAAAKAAGSTGSVSAHHAAEQARQRAEVQKAKAAAEAEAKAAPKPLTLVERMRQYVESMHIADKTKVQEAEQAKKDAEQAKKDAAAAASASAAKSGINGLTPASTSGHIHPSRSAPEGSAAAAASSASSSSSVVAPASSSSFSFRLKHPEHYSAVDIDIIKLTALYLARCGQEFLHGLQRREQRNAYFDFIKVGRTFCCCGCSQSHSFTYSFSLPHSLSLLPLSKAGSLCFVRRDRLFLLFSSQEEN